MEKFQGKYRIPAARAQWWDYSRGASYFLTICTKHGKPVLGKIINGQMNLSDIGIIVAEEWERSFSIREDLKCDVHSIMPNHLHAIVTLKKSSLKPVDGSSTISNQGIAYRPHKSVSSFVAGFKCAVSSRLRRTGIVKTSIWHPRFYDRIIRDKNEYERIKKYIIENASHWEEDSYYNIRSL
jgi:putative transposase